MLTYRVYYIDGVTQEIRLSAIDIETGFIQELQDALEKKEKRFFKLHLET